MKLEDISDILLDEGSSPQELGKALDAFAQLCSDVTGVIPNRSFDAWAGDSLLNDGVAINPEAAAHCIKDYQRSVVFIRAAYAAIKAARKSFARHTIEILYAGCGPFATLLLPLLGRFNPGELEVYLLDTHQRSLDSVGLLIKHFDLDAHRISCIHADACHYQHPGNPHVIIAETMQKSLEQEPQFAVTANLAPQLKAKGIFIPQNIEVELSLAHLDDETAAFKRGDAPDPDSLIEAGKRHPLATVFCLIPEQAAALKQAACQSSNGLLELKPVHVTIPQVASLNNLDAVLFTRVQAFEQHQLLDYESEITLPLRCHELEPLQAGDQYRISFQLGSYPKFCMTRLFV